MLQTFTCPLLVLQSQDEKIDDMSVFDCTGLCGMDRCSRHRFLTGTAHLQTSVLGNRLTTVPGYRLVLTFLIKADLAGLQ